MDNITNIEEALYVCDIDTLIQICAKHNLFYNIFLETDDGIKKTPEILHKAFIIENILNFLHHKIINKVVYSKQIQNYQNTPVNENSILYYGQYSVTNKNVFSLMKKLTDNQFKFGAISQKMVKGYWKHNKLITYRQFAIDWLKEYNLSSGHYSQNNKELAYNRFMAIHGNKDKWKIYKKQAILFLKQHKII